MKFLHTSSSFCHLSSSYKFHILWMRLIITVCSLFVRDGPLPQNKLRRKRKTALEQLEMDLSNVTEDSGRRASKRNKKMWAMQYANWYQICIEKCTESSSNLCNKGIWADRDVVLLITPCYIMLPTFSLKPSRSTSLSKRSFPSLLYSGIFLSDFCKAGLDENWAYSYTNSKMDSSVCAPKHK